MVPSAHVEPLHPGQDIPEALFHGGQGCLQRVGTLLAQRVEMESVQQAGQLFRHFPVPCFPRHAQAASLRAGIIDVMPFLGGAFRVDPQADAFPAFLRSRPELLQLPHGIEHNMVRVPQQLPELILPVSGAENMHLFPRHFLRAQPGFIQAAGLGSREIRGKQRVEIIVGEGFLGQQDPAPGMLRHRSQDPAVFLQPFLIHHIARRPERGEAFRRVPAGKTPEYFLSVHQSTSTGLWFSLRGRP